MLQLIQESHIKSKTDELELAKKKKIFFVPFILREGNVCFVYCYVFKCTIVLNTPSEYTYLYISKNIAWYTFFACF